MAGTLEIDDKYKNCTYIGEKIEGKEYKERRTAYGLISDGTGNIGIVIERGNMYNMIGGKIEEGEDSKETLERESKEEIGYELKNIKYLESLGCYHYLDFLDKYELAIMDFYSADIGEKICEPIEKDIKLIWVKAEDIADKMYFQYHRYFLERYIENNKQIER
jgi:8-oxo-dGTP pyrophosphatase MutT (NUDIX family)